MLEQRWVSVVNVPRQCSHGSATSGNASAASKPIGSDDDFHKQCRALGIPRVIHPPDNDSKRAFCHMREPGLSKANYTRVLEPAPYMERNQTIVEATALLLATPESAAPGAWSGSMSTVRYAQKVGRWVVLVGPDGSWDELGSLGGRPWDKGNWR